MSGLTLREVSSISRTIFPSSHSPAFSFRWFRESFRISGGAGIDAASSAGGGEVWVAAGVYPETINGTLEVLGGLRPYTVEASVVLAEGVSLYGGFTQDFDGEYFEVGYGTTIAEIDVSLSLILSNEDLIGENDEAIIFTLGKSFDL